TSTPTATPTPTASPTPSPSPTAAPSVTPCALVACSPPYPFTSLNPRTSIAFNESEVLRAFRMSMDAQCNPTTLQMFYNDEHAMTLGIREVQVITGNCGSSGSTTDYPFSPMASPGPTAQSAIPPVVGSTNQDGNQAG